MPMSGGALIDSHADSYYFHRQLMCHSGNACNDAIDCSEIPDNLVFSEDGKQFTLNGRTYIFTPYP